MRKALYVDDHKIIMRDNITAHHPFIIYHCTHCASEVRYYYKNTEMYAPHNVYISRVEGKYLYSYERNCREEQFKLLLT